MANVPTPVYDYEVSQLVNYYKKAVDEILRELERIDLSNFKRANAQAKLKSIADILAELDASATAWVDATIPIAARDGVVNTLLSLAVVDTVQEALNIVEFNRINQNMVAAAVADTQSDLLAITQNIDRKVKAGIRQAVADSIRANMTKGINGRKTISADILAEMRGQLGKVIETGIIDASGRRWKPEVYAEMVTRTKMMATYNEATTNESIQRGAYYAVISRHGATDACRYHEGRIMKLTPDAPGNYPTYAELRASQQIFHVNCKHVYSPIRNLERLPNAVKELADKQAERGSKALSTGKRNPKGID
jgi:peptidoglycan hydrolase-like protein with peptidoglycan-binding domain